MIHLIFNNTLYLNVDSYRSISVDAAKSRLCFTDSTNHSEMIYVCEHPKVQEIVNSFKQEEQEGVKTFICYKVLELIIERLSKTDENLPPIINLEYALGTIQKSDKPQEQETKEEEETKPAEVIPVTVDKDGNITKVLKEKN